MAVADWVYLTDTATGCSYYANLQTRETSWHRPAELDDPAAVAAAGSSSDAPAADAAAAPAEPTFVKMENGWFRYTDDASGRFYYYNKNTQKTKWSVPADALPAGEAADAPPAAPAPSSSSSAMTPREDYVSDEESEDPAPPPVPLAGYASSKSIGGDDDVDAPEENVYVRRLSGARLDSVENVGEAAAPEAQLSEEEAAAEKARKKAEKRAVRRAIPRRAIFSARNSRRAQFAARSAPPHAPRPPPQAHRLKTLEEIVETEKTYVQALKTLEKVYRDPLRMVAEAGQKARTPAQSRAQFRLAQFSGAIR